MAEASRSSRSWTTVGLSSLLTVGVIATTAGSVSAAGSAYVQPVQALEALQLDLTPDGTVTSIGRTDITTTDGSSFSSSSGSVTPSTAVRLPVVSTAWTYRGQTGTNLAGALSQLDSLVLHGGFKKSESFDPRLVVVDLIAGALQGSVAKGPESEHARANIGK